MAEVEKQDVDMLAAEQVEQADQIDQVEGDVDVDADVDSEKIKLLTEATSEDGMSASFRITDEDHTLGNALRYMIMKNPEVEFCGYSIPHPSENFLHIRIQTYGKVTAVEALHKGLQDLMDMCDAVEDRFTQRIREM